MINETGVISKWVLVHDGDKVIVAQYNEEQTTSTIQTIETFDTEEAMNVRIFALGLTPLPEEVNTNFFADAESDEI